MATAVNPGSAEHSKAVAEILKDDFECRQPMRLAVDFFGARDAAEAAQSQGPRLAGIHALANVFVDLHLQMRPEFLVQVLFEAAFTQQSAEASKEHTQLRHDISPDGFMNLAMMSEMRSQFSASAASCFWPARVMA